MFCIAARDISQMREIAAWALAAPAKGGLVPRLSCPHTLRRKFRLDDSRKLARNGRFDNIGCGIENILPQMRADAALATCPNINVGKVRDV
jgi:hypothetical protein